MDHLEILSEDGMWQTEAEHKAQCPWCKVAPKEWIVPHGQECRWVDERGNVQKRRDPLFESIKHMQ